MNRIETINELRRSSKVDVCVIGGGINGISTFRELALQGLNVLLVEQNDYCSGASAALSRMVHGGLRYLENGEFALVKEALVERDRLLQNAPHLIAPLPTVVPIFDTFSGLGNGFLRFIGQSRKPSRRGALAVKLGLTIYDVLTRKRRQMPNHEFRNHKQTLAKWPELDPKVKYSATYYDARVNHPERIGMELLAEAKANNPNALSLNYTSVNLIGDGKYRIVDNLTGEIADISPSAIVNATGGWIDIANHDLFEPSEMPRRLMGGTKGSHLIVRNEALKNLLDGSMIYYENADGRICILFQYLDNVLIGSTDIRVDDPSSVRCEDDERDYILQSLKYVLPNIEIKPEEVLYQFAGVRPLPASDDSFTGRIPRDHFCKKIEGTDVRPPVFCLVGGKWTTFRSFGELAADDVLEHLGRSRLVSTADRPIGGGADYPSNVASWVRQHAQEIGIERSRFEVLLSRYGTTATEIGTYLMDGEDESLPAPASSYSRRELQYLIEKEEVEHLADLILRRTTIAINGQLSESVLNAALEVLTQSKGWGDTRSSQEKQKFIELLSERHGVMLSSAGQNLTENGVSYAH